MVKTKPGRKAKKVQVKVQTGRNNPRLPRGPKRKSVDESTEVLRATEHEEIPHTLDERLERPPSVQTPSPVSGT